MTMSLNELLYQYSQAQDQHKFFESANSNTTNYYKGRMHMAAIVLQSLHPGWEKLGTIGYYIYHEHMSYADAEAAIGKYDLCK